jgi:hypothetical protein
LVTMGVYTGPEDFNKLVVRQLMVRIGSVPAAHIHTDTF